MKVGALLKVGNSVYLSVNNPKYIALKNTAQTYDYIHDDVRKDENIIRTLSHTIGEQTGYCIPENKIRNSQRIFSPLENVQLFIVELTEEEDQIIDNVADIMYSDYRRMPKTVPLVTLEKISISEIQEYLSGETTTVGEREIPIRDVSTLLLAFS